MKRTELLKALDRLYPAVAGSPITPEMADFRVKADTLRSTDGQMMVQVKLAESTGLDCRIPAKQFYKLLSSLKTEDIELRAEDGRLRIGNKNLKGLYQVADEGGLLDNLDFDVEKWTELPEGFLKGIKLCKFAVSRDVSRGPLCGIHIRGDAFTASDGFRIANFRCGSEMSTGPIVIPVDVAAQLERYGEDVNGWAVKKDVVYFRIGEDTIIAGKLLVGDYPDAAQFIEDSAKLKDSMVFPEETTNTLRRHLDQQNDIQVLDKEVTISVDGNILTVSSTDGVRYELEETLELEDAVKPMSFKIHPGALMGILERTRRMWFDDSSRFVVFRDENFTYLTVIDRT